MSPAAGAADAWLSLLYLQRSIGNSPMRKLLSRGNTSLYTTFEHFLSPCIPRADTQPYMLIGWQLVTHAHGPVRRGPAPRAAVWPIGLPTQQVAVIIVGAEGVECALQNHTGTSMKEHATAGWPAQSSESHDGRRRKERPLPAFAPSWKAMVAMP